MNDWKKNRMVAHVIRIICASCGDTITISNREESRVLRLDKDGELYFVCPNCKDRYDVPYHKGL